MKIDISTIKCNEILKGGPKEMLNETNWLEIKNNQTKGNEFDVSLIY